MINLEEFIKKYPGVEKPLFCQDVDDFYKLAFGTIVTAEDQSIGAMTVGMKIILHDYLALILQGGFSPIILSQPPAWFQERFRETILAVTEQLQKADIPMKEEDGKMKVDAVAITDNAWGQA